MNSPSGKRAVIVLLAVAALLMLPLAAQADLTLAGSFSIGIPDAALTTYIGPYLSVDVAAGGTGVADFTVTSLTNGNNLYLFGGNDALGLNFNIPTGDHIALTAFAGTFWDATGAISQDPFGSSGFGTMNTGVSVFDGYTTALKGLTFTATLLNSSGIPVAFPGGIVLVDNSDGYFAAAHIFVQNTLDTTDALATGFAGNGTQGTQVPVPPTVWLLGSGLIGVGLMRWRKAA